MGMDRERSIERFLPLRPVEFDVLLSLAGGERHGYGILQDAEARRLAALTRAAMASGLIDAIAT